MNNKNNSYNIRDIVNKNKKSIILTFSIFTTIFVAVSFLSLYNSGIDTFAATYGWVQSTWSGGADTVSTATHTSNQSGWIKYYSKDSVISTAGNQLYLATTSDSTTDTATADFTGGTNTNTVGASNELIMLKQNGAMCTAASQCASGTCTSSICR